MSLRVDVGFSLHKQDQRQPGLGVGDATDRNAREASARHGAYDAPTRRGLPPSAIRWRRASGAGGVNRRSDRQRRSARALLPWQRHSEAEQPREPKQSWRASARTPGCRRLRQRARFAGRPIPSKHNHVLHGHGPYRGTLRPRSRGCRLATRSGHLVPAGTRAAPYRPTLQRRHNELRARNARQSSGAPSTPAGGCLWAIGSSARIGGRWRLLALGVGVDAQRGLPLRSER